MHTATTNQPTSDATDGAHAAARHAERRRQRRLGLAAHRPTATEVPASALPTVTHRQSTTGRAESAADRAPCSRRRQVRRAIVATCAAASAAGALAVVGAPAASADPIVIHDSCVTVTVGTPPNVVARTVCLPIGG